MLKDKGILSPIQKEFLLFFSSLPDQERFYLTGGTALAAFYLGHRRSYDLDLFTSEENLVLPFSRNLEGKLKEKGWNGRVTKRFSSYVEFLVEKEGQQLRIDLAQDSPYRLEEVNLSEFGVYINSYKDIAAEKVLAYYGRWEPRDAVDLYFLMRKENVYDLLSWAKEKDPGFDLYWFAIALQRIEDFPDEAASWPVEVLLPWDPLELKEIFRKEKIKIMLKLFA